MWASDSSRRAARRPSGTSRPVYDTVLGEVLYHPQEDVLWARTHGGARMLCDCRAGTVSIVLGAPNGNADWLGSRPFLTLPLVELMKRQGLFCVHAAGLVIRGRAVVIAGPSGSGKTTLTIALLRGGFGFLSDDMVFLRPNNSGVHVLSFPDELDVTQTTARLFPELRELGDREPDPGWSKHRVRAEEVLPVELAPNVLLTEPAAARRHVDALAELVRASDCYELRVGDDLEAIPALLAEAAGGARP